MNLDGKLREIATEAAKTDLMREGVLL